MVTMADRKAKYGPRRKNKSRINAFTLASSFDIVSLDLFCSFVLSENRLVKRSTLGSLSTLLDMINPEDIATDPEKIKRINFIRKGLEGRLDRNINNQNLLLKYIAGGLNETFDSSINLTQLSSEEITWIISTITGALEYVALDQYCNNLVNTLTDFTSTEYANKAAIVDKVKDDISKINNEFRKIRNRTSDSEYFSLEPGIFENRVTNTYNELASPAHVLKSGMQGLNAMLHGGFESTRVYMFMGLPGEGKSLTLLNLAYQIARCNKDYIPKDPTKRPCVVYLTMENMDKESISRLYNIAVGNGNMTDRPVDQVINEMRTTGQLALNTPNDMDIIIKYVPDFSVDTSYLYDLTEDLRDDGKEVCCLIQDYIRKIRPVNYTNDTYSDLGAVVGEFKNYAIYYEVPVISASQCNREAANIIDQKRKNNKSDLVKEIGRSNVGDSVLIINNSDAVIMLTPELTKDGKKFMGLNLVKRRYTNTYLDTPECIYLPFQEGNGIKLLMDYGSAPNFKETLTEAGSNMMNMGIENSSINAGGLFKGSQYVSKDSIIDMTARPMTRANDGSRNLFDSSSVFSSSNMISDSERLNPFIIGLGTPDMYL